MVLHHCSRSQTALRIISVLSSSPGLLTHFSLHQFPGKKFALVQQTRAASADADKLSGHKYNPQPAPPSRSPGQCFLCQKGPSSGSFPKQKSLQRWKRGGSLPILISASFGERESCRTAPGIPTAVPRTQPQTRFQHSSLCFLPKGLPGRGSSAAALCPGWQPARRVPASTALQVAPAHGAGWALPASFLARRRRCRCHWTLSIHSSSLVTKTAIGARVKPDGEGCC